MKYPLVTISIPTLNSEKFLEKCLLAISGQTYNSVEINIVDGFSTDNTLEIAKKFKVKNIIQTRKALLGARYEGVGAASGKYILLLDCDQILHKTAIAEAVKACEQEGYGMLVLEEGVYQPRNFIEKLFQADRKLIHSVKNFDPFTGVMLPRFYKAKLLKKSMESIPQEIRNKVGGQDHAIIYFEAWKNSKKISMVSNAVDHIEPNSLKTIWKKFFRWGETSVDAHFGSYDDLLKKKERMRTGLFRRGFIKESIASILLLIIKGVPYKCGYYASKLKK